MGEDPQQGKDLIGNAYEHLDLPKRNEPSVSDVLRYKADLMPRLMVKPGGWSRRDIREVIEANANHERLSLRGPVQVAKGTEPVIVVNPDQSDALGVLFDIDSTDLIMRPYYALIETTGKEKPEKTEARLRWASIKPLTVNHLVVSRAVADALGGGIEGDIKITDVYQKIEDMDLDKL